LISDVFDFGFRIFDFGFRKVRNFRFDDFKAKISASPVADESKIRNSDIENLK